MGGETEVCFYNFLLSAPLRDSFVAFGKIYNNFKDQGHEQNLIIGVSYFLFVVEILYNLPHIPLIGRLDSN